MGSISCRKIGRKGRAPSTHVWYIFSTTVAGNQSTRTFQCTYMTFGASGRHLFNALKHLLAMAFQMHFLDKHFSFHCKSLRQKHRSLPELQNAGSVTQRLLCKENILLRPFGQHGFMHSFISHPCFKIILFS